MMRPMLLGIAGGTGSGKTTVSRRIVGALPAGQSALVQHDFYYKDRSHQSQAERDLINFDEPDALDNELLVAQLHALREGQAIEAPQYDFSTHTRTTATKRIEPAPIVVVEGILLFCVPALRDAFDLRIFVDTDDDIRLLRRIKRDVQERGRDVPSIERQYLETVRPMHRLHVAPTRIFAHLIIPEGGENGQAVDVIVGKLLHLLGGPIEAKA